MKNKNFILIILFTAAITLIMCCSSCLQQRECLIYFYNTAGYKESTGYYTKESVLRLEKGDTIFLNESGNWLLQKTDFTGIIDTIICNE